MSCLEEIMQKKYDKQAIIEYLKKTKYEAALCDLQEHLFLTQYEKGEFVVSPFQEETLFQVVVYGSISIYFIRDDGTLHSLSIGQENYLLGDMELFSCHKNNIYAEATGDLICIALSIEKNKKHLINNNLFLQLICNSLTAKLEAVTTIDAMPASLKERVLTYIKYKCNMGILKGLEQSAFHLNCSPRQLQRILNQYETEGVVKKIGKGTYQLIL